MSIEPLSLQALKIGKITHVRIDTRNIIRFSSHAVIYNIHVY